MYVGEFFFFNFEDKKGTARKKTHTQKHTGTHKHKLVAKEEITDFLNC